MKVDKKRVKNILLITLSNLGDIILTTPVLERLHDEFPEASIDIMTGAAGLDIFMMHQAVRDVFIRKKRQPVIKRLPEVIELYKKRYDLVVDLKNSLIPYLAGAKYHSRLSFSFGRGKRPMHKKDEHLAKLAGLVEDPFSNTRFFMPTNEDERSYIEEMMAGSKGDIVVMNPGSKSRYKRWDAAKYAELARRLVSGSGCSVFVIGNENDMRTVEHVISCAPASVVDLCCKTSIGALAELIRRADLIVTNDSAPLHVASAVNTPTIAIFGPSDEKMYGPLAEKSVVVAPDVSCRPCMRPDCGAGYDEGCISMVEVDTVLAAAREILKTQDSRLRTQD